MYPISLVEVDWRDLNRNLSMVAVKTGVRVRVEMGQEVQGSAAGAQGCFGSNDAVVPWSWKPNVQASLD